MELAAAHAWTKGGDLLGPGLRLQVLGPERPGPALGRSALINAAAFIAQKFAVFVRVLEMEVTVVVPSAVFPRELGGRNFQMSGDPLSIGSRQIDEAIASAAGAALSCPLALELNSGRVPGFSWSSHSGPVAHKGEKVDFRDDCDGLAVLKRVGHERGFSGGDQLGDSLDRFFRRNELDR